MGCPSDEKLWGDLAREVQHHHYSSPGLTQPDARLCSSKCSNNSPGFLGYERDRERPRQRETETETQTFKRIRTRRKCNIRVVEDPVPSLATLSATVTV